MGNVAIMGYGTVGSGVAEVLTKNGEQISHSAGLDVGLKYILDVRGFPDSGYNFITDFRTIVNDPEIMVVVETIGGATHALEFTRAALTAGKSVVTSNKELVACHGDTLLALAREHNANYLFEASVGGGIPIIRPMAQCLAANRLEEVCGILNGTTNYILTQMSERGIDLDTALKQAQELGYAERDPGDDILGKDVCRKVCILASLAFGRHIYPESVETQGIEDVKQEDMAWAKQNGCSVKLIGRAIRTENGITALVAPHMVPREHILSGVNDVYNGIAVCGDAIGDVMFYGRGAGRLPTASAVVADVIDVIKHRNARMYFDWQPACDGWVQPTDGIPARWYVRGEGLRDEKPVSGFAMRVLI